MKHSKENYEAIAKLISNKNVVSIRQNSGVPVVEGVYITSIHKETENKSDRYLLVEHQNGIRIHPNNKISLDNVKDITTSALVN